MAHFTPQEIEQFLQEFFDVVGTRQYTGARYVPIFGRKGESSIEWNNSAPYEPLTIVTNEGNSYTSRQYVPIGVDIHDADYWALTSNYNAQVEAYRQRVEEVASEYDTLVTVTKSMFHEDDKIYIFSDSTFQINPDPRTGQQQKAIYQFLSEYTDATIINRGVGGTSTAWLKNLLNSYSSSELIDATYIIVAYGTNDWQQNNTPTFIATPSFDTNFEAVYDYCIGKLEELAPNATIICTAMGYIHSPIANGISGNDTSLTNMSGNTFESYADVIAHVAAKHNAACLRLDLLLGITENNYTTKMVPSGAAGHAQGWDKIFVHYAEATNDKIARLIANGIFNTTGYTRPTSKITVSPNNMLGYTTFRHGIEAFYNIANQDIIVIPPNPGYIDFSFSAISNADYYLGMMSNHLEIYVDDMTTPYAVTRVGGTSVTKLPRKSGTMTIRLKLDDAVASSGANVANLNIFMGRPSLYDIGPTRTKFNFYRVESNEYITQTVDYISMSYFCKVLLRNTFNYDGSNYLPLPITIPGNSQFYGTVTADGVTSTIICRTYQNKLVLTGIANHAEITFLSLIGLLVG